jgi:hypothetical protein
MKIASSIHCPCMMANGAGTAVAPPEMPAVKAEVDVPPEHVEEEQIEEEPEPRAAADERVGDELPDPSPQPHPGRELQHRRNDRRRLEEAQRESDEEDPQEDQQIAGNRPAEPEAPHAEPAGEGVAGYH